MEIKWCSKLSVNLPVSVNHIYISFKIKNLPNTLLRNDNVVCSIYYKKIKIMNIPTKNKSDNFAINMAIETASGLERFSKKSKSVQLILIVACVLIGIIGGTFCIHYCIPQKNHLLAFYFFLELF